MGDQEVTTNYLERNQIVKQENDVMKAIYNMGGRKVAASALSVSTSAVGKWIRNGIIPNLNHAKKVAKGSGFSIQALRPMYEQKAE